MKNWKGAYIRLAIVVIGIVGLNGRSQATVDRIVDVYGQLSVSGNKIVDQHGTPVVLRGMSLFWSQWIGKYYNASCIAWLHDDWKCTIVRASMAVESGGYLSNPVTEMNKIRAVIDACIAEGIYVLIDWHEENAYRHTAQSIEFFTQIAADYGDTPNIIYEIYNEPANCVWNTQIKPYADSVVAAIREIDPNNIIVVGTPTWSQDVDVATANPVVGTNIAYALHYYAATHKQSLRNKATTALNRGAALWVTEVGTCQSSGSGTLDSAETRTWWNFLEANSISWCNWSIADKVETSAALMPNASATGGWSDSDLSTSGALVRDKIITMNEAITGIHGVSANPGGQDFRLLQNYPNPFNPSTVFSFSIPMESFVSLKVYDMLGRQAATIVSERLPAGNYSRRWNAIGFPTGVYVYRMETESFVKAGKMMLLK